MSKCDGNKTDKTNKTTSWKIETRLYISDNCNSRYQHALKLSDENIKSIKTGGDITPDILDFYLLDYLKNNPQLNVLDQSTSKFVIITETFLENYFEGEGISNQNENGNNLEHIKGVNIFDKPIIFVTYKNGQTWNLLVIKNIINLVKNNLENLENSQNSPQENEKVIVGHYHFNLETSETVDLTSSECDRILNILEKFLNYYACNKFNLENSIIEGLNSSSNGIDFKRNVLKNCNKFEDTGLIIANIIMEGIADNDPSTIDKIVRI